MCELDEMRSLFNCCALYYNLSRKWAACLGLFPQDNGRKAISLARP